MVAAGAGIAVVPELALTNLRADIAIHNLGSSAPMRTIAAATLANVHRSPATIAAARCQFLAPPAVNHQLPLEALGG